MPERDREDEGARRADGEAADGNVNIHHKGTEATEKDQDLLVPFSVFSVSPW